MSRGSNGLDVTRTAILALVGAQGPTSRAGLARALDVSPTLVTQLTKQLIVDGLLEELDVAPSQGGRPARLLGLTTTAGNAIGVKVVADHVTLVEVSIDGAVVRSATELFDSRSPAALSWLSVLVGDFLRDGQGPFLGIGVGLPGNVDFPSEGIVDSTQLGWASYPVGPTLRADHGLPVLVENNVNALTLAETLYGQGRDYPNLLVVTIGTGIGGGLVVDGSLVRGASGSAGQIGHMQVDPDGPTCQCGNRGCLEALIGEAALVRAARETGVLGAEEGIEELLSRADTGDVRARDVFAQAGDLLGRQLAGVANVIDPEAVLLLGEGVVAWRYWAAGFEPSFRRGLVQHRRGLRVIVETWQDDRWAQGAAGLVLSTPFDTDGFSGDQGRLVRQRLVNQSMGTDR